MARGIQAGIEVPSVDIVLQWCVWVMRSLRAWPRQGRKWGTRVPPPVVVLLPAQMFYLTLSVLELLHNWNNIGKLTETIYFLSMAIAGVQKSLVMLMHHATFVRLERLVQTNFDRPAQRTHPEFKATIKRHIRMYYWISGLWASGCCMIIIISVTMPVLKLLMEGRTTIDLATNTTRYVTYSLHNWTPIDGAPQPFYGIIFIFHQVITVFLGASTAISDFFFFSYTHHACAQFIILQRSLQELCRSLPMAETKGGTRTADHEARSPREAVADCVRHHDAILTFVKDLESIWNPILLMEFALATTFFCSVAVQLVVRPVLDLKTMYLLNLFSGGLFEMGLMCYVGSYIMEESQRVGVAAYSSQWYEAPVAVRRSLLLIMMRSSKPAMITFGKFAPLSLTTYAAILRMSYSFFTFIIQFNE